MRNNHIGKTIRDNIRRIVSRGNDSHARGNTRSDARRVLETIIFPYFVRRDEFSAILFIGCREYTNGYNKIFANKNYWTLEVDPTQREYGAKNHITDSLKNVHLHFNENELDLIVCSGVFGFGLNDKANVEKAFRGCFTCLREGGVFVLGWNDIPKHRPFPVEECQSLTLFNPHVFQPLSTSRYLTANSNRHIYNFYVKPKK